MKVLLHASAKKKTKRVYISNFYWPCSSDIMAVKGLIPKLCVCLCDNNYVANNNSVSIALFI